MNERNQSWTTEPIDGDDRKEVGPWGSDNEEVPERDDDGRTQLHPTGTQKEGENSKPAFGYKKQMSKDEDDGTPFGQF